MIETTVIRDSISDYGIRLLSIKSKIPETIWNEVLTHRVFSRNSSSSRAVPAKKWIAEARSVEQRVTPMYWGANQRGMQPGAELTGDTLAEVKRAWVYAANDAAHHAERMDRRGVHKEIINQILKPYVHAHVIITATEWMNFFGLRLDKHAKIEIRTLAEQIWKIWNEHVPVRVGPGQWHLPFFDDVDWEMKLLHQTYSTDSEDNPRRDDVTLEQVIKISVARCARVSYESHETGTRSPIDKDIILYDRLLADRHMSPFEHVATPDDNPQAHGNFVGWQQYRKQIPGEAVTQLPEEYQA